MEPDVEDLPHKRLSLVVNEFLEAPVWPCPGQRG